MPDSMLTALMARLAGVCGVHQNQRNASRESLIAKELLKLVEGDEARIKAFLKKIEKDRPGLAQVTEVTSEPYEGEVGRTSEVAMLCSFVQLDKAIPLLLDMRDDLKAVRKTSDATLDEVRAVRKTTDATLEEIKGMREDI